MIKIQTVVESNFHIRIFHNLELCTLSIQCHLRRLSSDVANKQRSIAVLAPMFARQRLQCEVLQVHRAQCRDRRRLQAQSATLAIVRLVHLNLYTTCAHHNVSGSEDSMQNNRTSLNKCKNGRYHRTYNGKIHRKRVAHNATHYCQNRMPELQNLK